MIGQLKSGKVDQIEKAQLQIKANLPSAETILAVVRRRILEDYKHLQSARAIDVKAAE